jgi:signal peptidase
MLIPKGMMPVTGVETPAMVVISGSMEPALRKGDMLFVHNMSNEPVREGEIVLFRVPGLEHPIVHRVIKVTTTLIMLVSLATPYTNDPHSDHYMFI